MNKDQLTTARWEIINNPTGLSDYSRSTIRELLDKEIGYSYRDPHMHIQTPIAPLPRKDSHQKVALCLGHARSGDQGAMAYNGVYEETFNFEVITETKNILNEYGIDSEIIDKYSGRNYAEVMKWLAEYLKENDFTLALEFHFNSYNGSAEGYEYLHWSNSKRGVKFAETFNLIHGKHYPKKVSRGAKGLTGAQHERGVLFTSWTHCPAIILEPFFGDNKFDAEDYFKNVNKLALMNAEAIKTGLKYQ